jgi:hypothetical protein
MGSLIKFYKKVKIFRFLSVVGLSFALGQSIAIAKDSDSISNLDQGNELLGQVENVRLNVRQQLDLSRRQRDVVKSLCVSDKLNQIDVAIRALREGVFDLKIAISRQDSQLADHKFTIISILRQKINQFSSEASQCVSYEAGFSGESSIKSYVDSSMPLSAPLSEEIIVQPPICSSCFK